MNVKEQLKPLMDRFRKGSVRVLPLLFSAVIGLTSCGSISKKDKQNSDLDSNDTSIELELQPQAINTAALPEEKLNKYKSFKDYNDVLLTFNDSQTNDYLTEGKAIVRDEDNKVIDEFKLDGREYIVEDLKPGVNYDISIEDTSKDNPYSYHFYMEETLGRNQEEIDNRKQLEKEGYIVLSRVDVFVGNQEINTPKEKGIEISSRFESNYYATENALNTLEGVKFVLREKTKTGEAGKIVEQWYSTESARHTITSNLESDQYILEIEEIPLGYDIPEKVVDIDLNTIKKGEIYGVMVVFEKVMDKEAKNTNVKLLVRKI